MVEKPVPPDIERKVVRRGLLAGLAGLGAAALLKLSGAGTAERAEAAFAPVLYPGAPGDGTTIQTAYGTTRINLHETVTGIYTILVSAATLGGGGNSRHALWAVGGGNGGVGVNAQGSGSFTGYGVLAQGGGSTGSSNGSPGVFAAGGGSNSGTGGPGVLAQGGGGNGKGVLGQSTSGDGVHGHSQTGVGLRGTSANFVGLVGISDNSIGLYGYNAAPNVPALFAENLSPNPANRFAARFNGDVWVYGNFVVAGGGKNAAVTMPDGSEAVLYCQESPEPYFEDFGRARLVNGVAHVQLEPEFATLIKRDDYMVFPVAEGESKGHLFVTQRNANGFEIREANGGTSSIPFTYRIVAKRKDIEGKRLARLDPRRKQNLDQLRAQSAAKMPSTAMAGRSEAPLVPNDPTELPPVPNVDGRR